MADNKYKFDSDNFDIKSESKASRISKIILTELVAIVFLAIAVFYILSYTTDTVAEKNIKHENKILKEETQKFLYQYKQNQNDLNILESQDTNLYKVIFGTSQKEDTDQRSMDIQLVQGRKAYKIAKKNGATLDKIYASYTKKKKAYMSFVDSLKNMESKIDSIPSIMPVPNPGLKFLIYGFGRRLDPIYHIPAFHSGIDIKAPFGTPVLATADGYVIKAVIKNKLKGDYVVIKHGNYTTGYYHLQKHIVRISQRVRKGQVIGYVGTSGKSLIEHLHYEIKYKGKYVNPIFYFFTDVKPSQYLSLYKKSTTAGISLD